MEVRKMKTISPALMALIGMSSIGIANAVPLHFDFSGQVITAEPVPNVFGLSAGDQIFGSAFIPDANLLGDQTYSPFDGSLSLTFDIGGFTFNETQDLGSPDFPTLDISNGEFVNLNFFVLDYLFSFSAFDGDWAADYLDFDEFDLQVVSGTFQATSVPEPKTLTLLTIGLLAIWLRARRARNSRSPL
jgi:hypothetical protein